jgi:putative transcriptional regulator
MTPRDDRGEELHSDLLDGAPEEVPAPRPRLRASLLATVAAGSRFEGFARRLGVLLDLPDEQVRSLLEQARHASCEPWVNGGGGIRLLHFAGGPRVANADCGFVYLEPGVAFPYHRHMGDEWALVLEGSAQDDSGRVARAGDLLYGPAGSAHSFRAIGPGPFLFAVVLQGGLDFRRPDSDHEA